MDENDIKALAEQLPVGLTKSDFRILCQKLWKHRPRKTLRLKRSNARVGVPGTTSSSSIEKEKHKKSRRGALQERQYLHNSKVTPAAWNVLGLLGLFYFEFKQWCVADYRHGSFATNYALMADLVRREGPAQVHAGIITLFRGHPLDWVSRKELEFLTDPSKWSRFVAPAIVQARKGKGRGEQSEWSGDRDEGFTVRRRK